MSRGYPIFVTLDSDAYQKPRICGARQSVEIQINVGSSKTNSHEMSTIVVTNKGAGKFTIGIKGAVDMDTIGSEAEALIAQISAQYDTESGQVEVLA